MRIPDNLSASIERVFGEKGQWLAGLDDLVEACRRKWALTDCTPVPGAFVDMTLGTSWSFEDNLPPEGIQDRIAACTWLLDQLKRG